MVLAEGLEVVQQALDQRCGGRRMAAFVACSIMEAVEQGLPGAVCRGLPAKLRAFTGTGEHHDGDRRGDRLRGYLGRLLQVCAAGGQVLGYI